MSDVAPVPESPAKDVPCAYCGTSVVGGSWVICAACDVPLHRDCWHEGKQCPAYACGSLEVLDPALAFYRRSAKPEAVGAPPATVPPPAAQTATPPATPPAEEPQGVVGRLGQLARMMLGTETRFSAVSIDIHLGGFRPDRWLRGLKEMVFGPKLPIDPAVARVTAKAEDVLQEVDLLEQHLAELRWHRWLRRTGQVAGFLLFPVLCKLVGKFLFFPMLIALFAWSTYPGWKDRKSKKHEKAIQKRLDELHVLLAQSATKRLLSA